jgi:hypothetical protein
MNGIGYETPGMRRLVCLLTLLLVAACRASDPEVGVSRERVALTGERRAPADSAKQPPAWFEEQLALVEQDRKAGRIREALVRILRAKEQDPGADYLRAFDRLVSELNREVLEMNSLVGWFVADRDPILFGEALRVRVRLHAQVVRNRRRMYRALGRELDFPPGSTREIILDLGPVDNDRPLAGFRSFTIGGELRAGNVEVGGLRRWEAIRVADATLRSFRPGYEHLAGDPVHRIDQAIEKGALVHLLTATALVPYERRQMATDRLILGLGRRTTLDWALFACLQYITGTELGRDVDAWRAWWPRVRETYFAPKARPRSKGEPVFSD